MKEPLKSFYNKKVRLDTCLEYKFCIFLVKIVADPINLKKNFIKVKKNAYNVSIFERPQIGDPVGCHVVDGG
jgi:hypothetical protein